MRCSSRPSRDTERPGWTVSAGSRLRSHGLCARRRCCRRRQARGARPASPPPPAATDLRRRSRPRQFRPVGRQQRAPISAAISWSGSATRPRRLRPRVAQQSRRRRRLGEHRRRRASAPGSRPTAFRPGPTRKAISSATSARPMAASPGFGARVAPGVNVGFRSTRANRHRRAAGAAVGDARPDSARLQRLGRQGAVDLGGRAGARFRQDQFQPRHRLWPRDRRLQRPRSTVR